MSSPLCRLLVVGTPPHGLQGQASPWGALDIEPCNGLQAAAERLAAVAEDAAATPPCALLIALPQAQAAAALPRWPGLPQAVQAAPVLALLEQPDAALVEALVQAGVQDVLPLGEPPEGVARAVLLAVLRRRREQSAVRAYATDLATGLPHEGQLLEHMNHLLALREREPAPMALIVIRVEGLATAQARLGEAAAGALRRKLAVRLRGSLRASDVVASLGGDAFAVLLAWIDCPAAAEPVAAKLSAALSRPVQLAGGEVAVALAIGIARYPEHGKDAHGLLAQARAGAQGFAAVGRAGFANFVERGPGVAAND